MGLLAYSLVLLSVPAELLDLAPEAFRGQTPLAGCHRRPSWPATPGRPGRPPYEVHEPRAGRLAVLGLGPVLPAVNQQHAVSRDSVAAGSEQPPFDFDRERRSVHIEPEFD